MTRFFRFILGIGYIIMSGFCIYGLYCLLEESSSISDTILYILLFVGIAILLWIAAFSSFKMSALEDEHTTSEDTPVKNLLVQRKNVDVDNKD